MQLTLFRSCIGLTVLVLQCVALPTVIPAQPSSSFSPAQPDSSREVSTHVINPLDRLLIVVYAGERQTAEYQKVVQSDGTVYLPYLERDVQIGGLVISEAERMLEELSRKVVREPRVVLTILSSYSQSVSTYGKIASRTVELNTPMRVLQLLARVGGPLEGAIEDSIRVISNDGSLRFFNYRQVNRNPDDTDNFLLKPGDIVYVPGPDDFTVLVFGEVKNAGAYSMKNGDRILDAVLRAGSWTTSAEIGKLRMLRSTGAGRVTVSEVDLRRVFNNADIRQNQALRNGDIVYIPEKRTSIMQPTYLVLSMVYMLLTSMTLYDALKD
jgi:protein involved in polysaccharide export with SLBB domain